jgi:hypothetical protein
MCSHICAHLDIKSNNLNQKDMMCVIPEQPQNNSYRGRTSTTVEQEMTNEFVFCGVRIALGWNVLYITVCPFVLYSPYIQLTIEYLSTTVYVHVIYSMFLGSIIALCD